jgi:hypothetical protein
LISGEIGKLFSKIRSVSCPKIVVSLPQEKNAAEKTKNVFLKGFLTTRLPVWNFATPPSLQVVVLLANHSTRAKPSGGDDIV